MGSPWLILRLVHIVAGTFWAGGAILVALYLLPAVRAAGPGGAAVLRELTVSRRLPEALLAAGLAAIASGALLLWIDSDGFRVAWFARPQGVSYLIGALAALGVVAIGLAVNIPGAKLIGRLTSAAAARGTPLTAAETELLQRTAARVGRGTLAGAALLTITTATMAIARTLA